MKTEGPEPPTSCSDKVLNLCFRWGYSDAFFFHLAWGLNWCYPASAGGSTLFFFFTLLPVLPKLLLWSLIMGNQNHNKRVCHDYMCDEPVEICSTARCFSETLLPRKRCCRELIHRWWSCSDSEKAKRNCSDNEGCSPAWLEYIALSVLTLFRTCAPLPCMEISRKTTSFFL